MVRRSQTRAPSSLEQRTPRSDHAVLVILFSISGPSLSANAIVSICRSVIIRYTSHLPSLLFRLARSQFPAAAAAAAAAVDTAPSLPTSNRTSRLIRFLHFLGPLFFKCINVLLLQDYFFQQLPFVPLCGPYHRSLFRLFLSFLLVFCCPIGLLFSSVPLSPLSSLSSLSSRK